MEKNHQSKLIRNFSIIAHVDHGKSTLADKIISLTKGREKKKNYKALDVLEVEKKKGITIKLNPIRLEYKRIDSESYVFNLIDTPGHADFGYEVSRSLASCEGVLLLVDSTKGIQAQTIAYLKVAKGLNLKILPVINKIDLVSSMIEETKNQMMKIANFKEEEFSFISSKDGTNIDKLLEKIVDFMPSPKENQIYNSEKKLRALVFDLSYSNYLGVIVFVRIFNGKLKNRQKIKFFYNQNKTFQVEKIGIKNPENLIIEELREGEIGWFSANIRNMSEIQVGETVFNLNEEVYPLPGYQKIKPNIYSNFYPESTKKYKETRKAINELMLQDSSFSVNNIESSMLGSGFRCGFLGLLHKEVIEERIKHEHKLEIITTPPTVTYKVILKNGNSEEVTNAQKFPEQNNIRSVLEPFINVIINVPEEYMGEVTKICQEKRGIYKKGDLYGEKLWIIEYEMPFSEFIFDFNDKIKSISQGYASFEYDFIDFRESKIIKIDVLLNKKKIDDLSFLVHQSTSYEKSRKICEEMKVTLNVQNFEISIQACIGKRVLARETIKPYRKDVIGKCYGGDVTRKKKLLEKQKKGKKKMKESGEVSFSEISFREILKKRSIH